MNNGKLRTPVLLLIFNRPDTTRRVFETIRAARPERLFVAADGPRREGNDAQKCEVVRDIIKTVDWDCSVSTLFRETNLGCRNAVSSAIDWFFSRVDEGIVLEDDCVPNLSFFRFCQDLLDYYRLDTRVMQICGTNVLGKWAKTDDSYFFSQYGPIWGWASWARAWKHYDVNMSLWPRIRERKVYSFFCQNEEEAKYRVSLYDKVYSGEINTWDYQWGFAKMINSGLSVIPSVNLISNIGFHNDATHTVDSTNPCAALETYELPFPLDHPDYVMKDSLFDTAYCCEFMGIRPNKGFLHRFLYKNRP